VVAVRPAGVTRAQVAPSVDDNTRYLKVTPQADRVRLAYTVFFGEVPGAQLRPALDTNGDGTIGDAEAQVFGDKVAADVLAALEVAVDDTQQRLAWRQVAVGLGSPAVRAGAFSIDMVAYVCLTRARGRHTVRVRDRFRVPKPGETEVRVEDGLGIRVERARIGDASALNNDFKMVGPGGPLADDGLDVVYVANDQAQVSGECAATAPDGGGVPWLPIAIGAAVVAAVTIAVARSRRRRRCR
jgi:hypothetical protein